ncbi:MAG: histidine kinase [Acidobacteriaceae bacterium]|nr:histidine kinase [Acidobacteriaceae bacterium]
MLLTLIHVTAFSILVESISPLSTPGHVSATSLQLHAVGVVLGLLLSGFELQYLWSLRKGREVPRGLVFLILLLVVSSLLRTSRFTAFVSGQIASEDPGAASWILTFSSIVLTPLVLLRYYGPVQRRQKLREWAFWAMLVNAAITWALFVFAILTRYRLLAIAAPSLFCIVAVVLLAVTTVQSGGFQLRRRGLTLSLACMAGGLAGIPLGLIPSATRHVAHRNPFLMSATAEIVRMLIVLGSLFLFSNLPRIDVLIKRVVRVYLWVLSGFTLWYLLYKISGRLILEPHQGVQLALGLLGTATAAAIVFGAAWLYKRVDHFIEQELFEQPDFYTASSALWGQLIELSDERSILQLTTLYLRSTLGLDAIRIVAHQDVPGKHPELSLVGGGVYVLHPKDPAASLTVPAAEYLIPMFQEGLVRHVIALGTGRDRPALLQTDIAFLLRTVSQVETRFEALAAELARFEKQKREMALRQEIAEAELRALQAQINPHFLFNSLNTIAELAVSDPSQAEEMTLRLARSFRYVLANSERRYTSLWEEIEFARNYLDIERARFGEKVRISFEVDPELHELQVPVLLLQPLIENSLKHGIGARLEGGAIRILASRTQEGVMICVQDDGVGLQQGSTRSSQEDDREHFGLSNVRRRLASAFGERASFSLHAIDPAGVEACILIRS